MYTDSLRQMTLHTLMAASMAVGITLVLLPFENGIELAIVVLVYLLPVGISAARWGMGTGIFSAAFSFLLINYFFTEPVRTFRVGKLEDLVALAAFLMLTITISQLVGRMKNSLALATARENETARLYELSTSLARLPLESDIILRLAQFTHESFQPTRVEVYVEGDSGPILVPYPPGDGSPSAPDLVISMQGAQRLIGEIRLWREKPIGRNEQRLLSAFAAQGTLALERARLTSAEARAKILEESDRMKAALLSSVSHELRSPLATIKASVSSLNREDIPWETESRHELLTAIEEEADHLNQLVGNLLNMSRIEAGALKLQRRWNVLREVASAAVRKARSRAREHLIKLDISGDLPLVFLDDILMEQVFINLIDNSCKYSPPGTEIRIQSEKRGEMVWTLVSNQSPSVSDQDLERIFNKFQRVTAAEQVTGTGLGLSICKGIIEAHRGQIRAVNLSDGFGIEFIIPLNATGIAPRIPQP